jgi:hypothetical protein
LLVSPGDGHEEHGSSAKRVVVLGDDQRPRPTRRPGRPRPTRGGSHGAGGRALYNHCTIYAFHTSPCLVRAEVSYFRLVFSDASGGGWWHGDMGGLDGEEVGWTDDMWEGMGSVTLGGLEWHYSHRGEQSRQNQRCRSDDRGEVPKLTIRLSRD